MVTRVQGGEGPLNAQWLLFSVRQGARRNVGAKCPPKSMYCNKKNMDTALSVARAQEQQNANSNEHIQQPNLDF